MDHAGKFEWRVRVTADRGDCGTVYARKHQFQVGAPLDFDREYRHVSALELVLGAIGSDLVNGLRLAARRRRVEIEGIEAVVHGQVNNPLKYLGVIGENGHPGLQRVTATVYVSSMAAPRDMERIWGEMLERSPLFHTFQPLLDLELNLKTVL